MRRHRLHLPELSPGRHTVTGSEAVHLATVLRVSRGSPVRAFDGRGREADGRVREVDGARVTIELQEPREAQTEAALQVTVAVALLKGDKLADVVRHCTELGAVRFCLLLTRHADVPRISDNKLGRLRRIAAEAAKQSGRALVPEVAAPVRLDALQDQGALLVAHPDAEATVAEAAPRQGPLTVVSGPEGGFADDEVELLRMRGAVAVRLGARVLRAETAPVALLAALLVPEAL